MSLTAQSSGGYASARLRPVASARNADPRPSGVLATPGRRHAALAGVLGVAAALYTVGLSASGWANSYYAAAAQAGASSWRAMLFGGLDPSGGITVDKPPAALWIMDVSVRLFGLSPWSVLLPQAACGVGSVALLYATVRRQALSLDGWPGSVRRALGAGWAPGTDHRREARATAAGLLAAAALAVTPVATLMARYDNPDEFMLLALVAAAYALTRSVEAVRGGGGWLVLSGVLLGLAFLAKMLQAWLVLPAFLAVAVLAGAGSLARRLGRCALAGVAMLASAGWWVLVVQTTPATQRPWIGGSQSNSVLELALGYNGLGRLTGQEASGGASDVPRAGSLLRLVSAWGPESSWLLPTALLALVAAGVLTRRRTRRDPVRAGLLLWGVWLVVVAAVLSSLHGIAHGYYTVELAPAIAGSVALGGSVVWRRSWGVLGAVWPRRLLAAGLAGNAVWVTLLMAHQPSGPLVVVPTVLGVASVSVLVLTFTGTPVATGASAAGPTPGSGRPVRHRASTRAVALTTAVVGLLLSPAAWSVATAETAHRGPNVAVGPGPAAYFTPGGVSPGSVPGDSFGVSLAASVARGAAGYRWAAAVVGHRAADLQLASGAPVWALGGYSGNDPHPTVPEFEAAALGRRVHYLVFATAEANAQGQAGDIVRWALRCLPVRSSGGWLVADLGSATSRAAGCRGA